MKNTYAKALAPIFAFSLLAGCAAIGVEVPQGRQTITTQHLFTVNIHRDADPSSVQILLDGDDITNLFGPIGAGARLTAIPPALRRLGKHEFDAKAQFVGGPRMFGISRVTVEFYALSFTLDTASGSGDCNGVCRLRVREGETADMRVSLPEAPYGDLAVTISTDNRNLSLNEQNAGDPITVTIPGNERSALFTLRAIARGTTRLTASGRATNSDDFYVTVE